MLLFLRLIFGKNADFCVIALSLTVPFEHIKGVQKNFFNSPQKISFKSISYVDQCGTTTF